MQIAEDPTVSLEERPELYEALKEGYDARNRGDNYDDNPYDKQEQPKRHEIWRIGLRACRRDEIRHRIRLDAATGVVYGIEVRAPTGDHVCNSCREQDGTVYSIDEALEVPPIPHEHCESGRCQCVYISITDQHHPEL